MNANPHDVLRHIAKKRPRHWAGGCTTAHKLAVEISSALLDRYRGRTLGKSNEPRRTPKHCHGPDGIHHRRRGRSSVLLARSADVHVDFHADRHFHDLRSFPSHSGSPQVLSEVLSATSRRAKPRAALRTAQAWNRTTNTANCRVRRVQFTLGQPTFAPSQARPLSTQEPQQCATRARLQLLRIQRSILVGIRGVEALLHHGEIFIERQRPIVIRVGGGEFFRR